MKKIFTMLFAATAVLAGCSKVDEQKVDSGTQSEYGFFCGSIDQLSDPTRTTMDEFNGVQWEKDDEIVAYPLGTTDFSTADHMAFSADKAGAASFFSASNISAAKKFHADNDATGYDVYFGTASGVPSIPSSIDGYVSGSVRHLPMHAKVAGGTFGPGQRKASFNNVCAVLKVTVPGSFAAMNKFVVTAAGEDDIAGKYRMTDSGVEFVSDASTTITYSCAASNKAKVFYIPVKPGSHQLTLTACEGDKVLGTMAMKAAQTMAVNTIYPIDFEDYSGVYVILAKYGENYYAMSGDPGSNSYMPKKDYTGTVDPSVAVNVDDNEIIWIIAKTADGYTLKNASNDKYLYYNNSGNSSSVGDTPNYHTILPSTDGTVNIKDISSTRLLRYNTTNPRFAYYTSATGTADFILQPATYVVVPKISVTSTVPVEVEAAGATGKEVTYSITNPDAGKNLSASCEESWVKNLSCATEGKVTFDVDANTGTARTATITLKYDGATDVTFDVKQSAAGATVFSCTFKSKAWAVVSGEAITWTSDKDAYQYSSPNVQVTSAYSGAGATTKETFTDITKIRVKASTTSKGVGNITVKVGTGSSQTICSLSKNSTATWYELDLSSSPVSGQVSFVVTCSTNSMYVQGFEITAAKKETK